MDSLNRLSSCRFQPLVDVEVPEKALVWTSNYYYDGAGWVALPNREVLSLKPTLFVDNRLLFLERVDGVCDVFKDVQSGKYDVQCWSKMDCYLGIEGDQNVFLLTPNLKEVAVYSHTERLPAFPKSWKPLIFTVNMSMITFRLTDKLCLVVTIDENQTISVQCVDYNGGFAVSHPATNMALAYGCMATKGFEHLPNCEVIPRMNCASGDWGFFVELYKWGLLVLPKSLDLSRPASVLGLGLGKKTDCLGLIMHPPNMFIFIHLESPKVQRPLEYGIDYLLTAVKSSETDIDIFLLMDGQLVKANYSFDIRVNKPDKPKHTDNIGFKCTLEVDEKKKCTKFVFANTKHTTVIVSQGCPSGQKDHLVTEQLIALYDAEICMYLTHPPALKLCSAFATVAMPVD